MTRNSEVSLQTHCYLTLSSLSVWADTYFVLKEKNSIIISENTTSCGIILLAPATRPMGFVHL
jgi:hypothetical protein